ncbi:transcription factor bHLH128-like [Amaranthus tricolor]|uniref:transcription factor bHLH128-like n=1 Tax=Amaranthus tricolor TaxID=29722 RepID=UPI00258AAD9E|nr:transcription factor bHLH128-like [Amaranthus tricolor]
MYSSSSSSSQQQSSSNNQTNPNLIRYDSAPNTHLSNTVDSVVGLGHPHHQFFSESTQSKLSSSGGESSRNNNTLSLLHQGTYGMDTNSSNTTSSGLIRHSSSPAGLLSHLASDLGYTGSKGFNVNYNGQGSSNMISRLGSQLSFTRKDHSMSQITEVNESIMFGNESKRSSGFSLSAWDDTNDNSFIISSSSTTLNALDPQHAMALEMATMEGLMKVPQDSVPCKIRAKRGCATHPRSIAERERRTRISGKLKKLQELVPNMDKQTSYADMLDLAVQHIKGLQNHIEKLNNELEHCKCGCKQNTHS